MIRFIALICIVLFALTGRSQDRLSLEEAVNIGLEANRTLDRYRLGESVAIRMNTPGAAGRLPSLNLSSRAAFGLNYSRQEYFNGESQNTDGASDFSLQSGLELDYVLYEGNAKNLRAERLGREVEIAGLYLLGNQRLLTADIAAAYTELTWRSKRINIREQYLQLLEDFLKLEEQKAMVGSASRVAVLQARADLQEGRIQLETERLALEQSRLILNNLLYMEEGATYRVDTTFIPMKDERSVSGPTDLADNPDLIRMRLMEQQAQLDVELRESQRYPVIGSYAGLYHAYGRSGSGFLTSNRTIGPEVGLSLTYPLYDGNRVDREIEVAQLELEKARVETEETLRSINRGLELAQAAFLSLDKRMEWAEKYVHVNADQLELAREQYRAGRLTVFDFRQTRQQWLGARLQWLDIRYQLAVNQINILYLSGEEIIN